jgi:hypothetical protein
MYIRSYVTRKIRTNNILIFFSVFFSVCDCCGIYAIYNRLHRVSVQDFQQLVGFIADFYFLR